MPKSSVYLIHFEPAYKHAGHYLGYTKLEIDVRFNQHVNGTGARLTQVAVAAGHTMILARVWPGETRTFERKLKKRGGARRICPICLSTNTGEPS